MKEFVTQLESYSPSLSISQGVSAKYRVSFSLTVSLFFSRVSLSLSLPRFFPTPSHTISSSLYNLPSMGLSSWVAVFPKKVGPILTYIPSQMGLATHFWTDSIGTCASLQIYAQQADISKALYNILGAALGRFVLYHARTLHHLFVTTWMDLTYGGLGLGPVFDLWTV